MQNPIPDVLCNLHFYAADPLIICLPSAPGPSAVPIGNWNVVTSVEQLAILQANLFYYEPAVSVLHKVIVKNRYSQILTTTLTMHPLLHFLFLI